MDGISRVQRIAVVVFAIVVVAVSVLVTLFVSDSSLNPWRSGDRTGYQNVTFTDAVLTCESATKERFADQIKFLLLDNHSSRYDEREFLYKIFYTIDRKQSEENGREAPPLIYINCYVSGRNGRIEKYDVHEHVDDEVKPVTKQESGIFGWSK